MSILSVYELLVIMIGDFVDSRGLILRQLLICTNLMLLMLLLWVEQLIILVDFVKNSKLFLGLLEVSRKEACVSAIIDPALLDKRRVLVLDRLQCLRVLILEETEERVLLLLLLPFCLLVQLQ